MPIINVDLIRGYSSAARQLLAERLTDACTSVIKAPADLVTVLVREVDGDNYMRGRTHRSPGPAHADQADVVRDYLAAMERRDLAAAEAFLAPGFTMRFPGDRVFQQLAELIEWGGTRYQSIGKSIERVDVCPAATGAVVYCYGTLHGRWPEGGEFSGIRFIDRFEVSDGLLVSQDVWNDLAEHRAA